MKFKLIDSLYEARDTDTVYLIYIHWDDYGYCTEFEAYYLAVKEEGLQKLGVLKIGCYNLKNKVEPTRTINDYLSYSIKQLLPKNTFKSLPEDFFSLGQDINYYKNINRILDERAFNYYESLRDLSSNIDQFKRMHNQGEPILINSLMRNLYYPVILQFCRIIHGESELTPYSFDFKYDTEEININVVPDSKPPSNIHVLIGRNGVGKTWLLYNIVNRLLQNSGSEVALEPSKKYEVSDRFSIECAQNSFSGVIGISFSVFDDALCLEVDNNYLESLDKKVAKEKLEIFNRKYKYIGLVSKNQKDGKTKTKSVEDLKKEFRDALKRIKMHRNKIDIYLETCRNLNTDPMFSDNEFIKILECYLNSEDIPKEGYDLETQELKLVMYNFNKLSSGHMIIMLSLTLLSESIYEKTIVVIDEPETHLHPPLLSTYIRTLSYLLVKKNAVAIIATHSPIVLQEVPRNCVNRVDRVKKDMYFSDIKIESFATSIDSLTREVFGLELIKTGFYQLIERELESDFEKTLEKFEKNVGYLGQVLIQSLVNKAVKDNEEN
ncbi:AAA family ATPase [Clostridium sp. YIM B02505]|uniref:AAA family ATPase n=1 Tax=Clostridium yunnanense TaxID=2800325 RepID=A0ABS1EQM6_9CLOT|nr:AAA family ATPase [Clostridium yunnanense]MBK1811645.1 AAA family ATPase [Clostridium yunnanense]